MKIAFFGSSLVSSYWNGAATYYRGILRAMHERGHQITFYEPDAYNRQKNRDIPDPPYARVVVYPVQTTDALYECLDEAHASADLIVKASGVGVFDTLLEGAVLNLKSHRNTIAFWDVDAPATLDRMERDPEDPFRRFLPNYDLILTYGGGTPVISAYTALGAPNCIPIYNALDPQTHHPVAPDPRFNCDLAFLGNRLPDLEARVEAFFLNAAAQSPNNTFILGGSGWHDKPLPHNVRWIGHVSTNDHNALNSTPRLVLNISRDSMARYGFSPATRVFEAAGAGACLITDAWKGIEEFLEPQTEVLIASTGDDVARYVRDITREQAYTIGTAALKRVLTQHTYAHRAEQLEQILSAHIAHRPQPVSN